MGREIAFLHPLLKLTHSNTISKPDKSKQKKLGINAKNDKML